MSGRKRSGRTPAREWGAWYRCDTLIRADGSEAKPGKGEVVMRNELYTVFANRIDGTAYAETAAIFGDRRVVWLSIKRNDRKVIHDWRHLQRIKNELLGPEVEAVELYPAESRLVDTSNQFHLWAVDDPTYRFPFGYRHREVLDDGFQADFGARQRPLDPGTVTTTGDELRALYPDDEAAASAADVIDGAS